ncbi:MAG: DeoR/GlpR family DNA-binding transcription regulator [Desulfobacterales bacterium]|nr:DeoR/GlpR family DNA-binding transcription regulator [Desulfobacterales bacterium]
MTNKVLKIDERRGLITEFVAQKGKVRVSELSEKFGTTGVTIRNDLGALEAAGYLKRVPGGAVHNVNNFYNLNFIQRNQQNAEFKCEVGKTVSELIHDNETLFINSGATTYYTAVALKRLKNLRIVTNSISIVVELGTHLGFQVILLGGKLNPQYAFTYGADALEQLSHYKADVAILSIDGIHPEAGFTTYHPEEAVIDREMISRSRRCIIASDYKKIGHESFSFVADGSNLATVVTNKCIDPDVLSKFRSKGFNIVT